MEGSVEPNPKFGFFFVFFEVKFDFDIAADSDALVERERDGLLRNIKFE
jgi:hypothetical protein